MWPDLFEWSVDGGRPTLLTATMDTVILEEDIDENYEPTEAEIVEYATWLGMVRASPPLRPRPIAGA